MQQWEQKSDLTLYLVMIVKYQDLSIYHQFAYNTGKIMNIYNIWK